MNKLIRIAALTLGLLGGIFLSQSNTVNAQEAAEIDTSGIVEMTMGPADAKVTVIEYASFTCPHCANFHKDQFQKLKADYIDTGKIHFIYRDVYFDQLGVWAAMTARCDGPERFFDIADMLYTRQADWIGDGDFLQVEMNLAFIGHTHGLSLEQFSACIEDDDKARALIEWFRNNAETDGINSTPSLVINGQKYENMHYDDLKDLIEKELAD